MSVRARRVMAALGGAALFAGAWIAWRSVAEPGIALAWTLDWGREWAYWVAGLGAVAASSGLVLRLRDGRGDLRAAVALTGALARSRARRREG